MSRRGRADADAVADDPRVDQLRNRLRSLGYLDAGVDRFVLGPARSTRTLSSIALLSSARVGALAAVLLGPAAALGLGARMPGLVTGPRDALVIALYLGMFFGLALGCAALVAGFAVAVVGRSWPHTLVAHSRVAARLLGGLVGLLCLVYLTFWWQTVIAGVGWSAPIWTLTALAIAAAISLLLGHAVAVMIAALVAVHGDGHIAGRAGSWRTSVAAGIVAFGGAVLLLAASASTSDVGTPAALTVVPSGLRIRVVAVDGFDARIFDKLASAGRVPALASVFTGTVVRLDHPPGEAADPARVWTTIATGQPASVHAVRGLETRRIAGVAGAVVDPTQSPVARTISGATDLLRLTRPSVATGAERRAKTFWEVASQAGLRTSVVNWWATWPARDGAGVVLSDRATLRLERGGDLDAEIAPSQLYDALRVNWPTIKARAALLAGEAVTGASSDIETERLLRRSAELDAVQLLLMSEVTPANGDLSVVYLSGLDIAQHTLLSSGGDSLGASTLGARLDALEHYYVALDRLLTSTGTFGSADLKILITEPGRIRGQSGALLAASGSAFRAAARREGAATSVAPTLLHALGVPIAEDLAGTPMTELFEGAFTARHPVRTVPTYGAPSQAISPRGGTPLDQEMIDRLRSLGYLR